MGYPKRQASTFKTTEELANISGTVSSEEMSAAILKQLTEVSDRMRQSDEQNEKGIEANTSTMDSFQEALNAFMSRVGGWHVTSHSRGQG